MGENTAEEYPRKALLTFKGGGDKAVDRNIKFYVLNKLFVYSLRFF